MQEEFLEEILEYEDDLKARAMSLLDGDESDSADLVQDTIIKALKNEEKFEKGTNLRAWLLTIEYHLFVNDHRREKKFNEIIDQHKQYTMNQNSSESYTTDPLDSVEMESILAILREELDDIFYDALYAVDVEGLAYKETAERLDVPTGTIMSRLYRARRKARETLCEKYDVDILEKYVGREAFPDDFEPERDNVNPST